jgi:hypothetical protein
MRTARNSAHHHVAQLKTRRRWAATSTGWKELGFCKTGFSSDLEDFTSNQPHSLNGGFEIGEGIASRKWRFCWSSVAEMVPANVSFWSQHPNPPLVSTGRWTVDRRRVGDKNE